MRKVRVAEPAERERESGNRPKKKILLRKSENRPTLSSHIYASISEEDASLSSYLSSGDVAVLKKKSTKNVEKGEGGAGGDKKERKG